jgi:hypothetical protein
MFIRYLRERNKNSMKKEIKILECGGNCDVITASAGKVFIRKADGFLMGEVIYLGNCTLTGEKDLCSNYDEVDILTEE